MPEMTEEMHILEHRAQHVVDTLEELLNEGRAPISGRATTALERAMFHAMFRGKLLDVLVERGIVNPRTHVYEGFEDRRGQE